MVKVKNNIEQDRYITALSLKWLTRYYDGITWLVRENTFKRHLVERAQIKSGERVLDLGCGTATLTIMIKKSFPEAEVTGLDGDPDVLEKARAKIAKAGLNVTLDKGMAFELPYPECHFDHVFSSLVFHHLTRENKLKALTEVFRVLRPGGYFYLADFGKLRNVAMYLVSLVMRHFEEYRDNINGLLLDAMRGAGFQPVDEFARYTTIFGTLCLYRACKPT